MSFHNVNSAVKNLRHQEQMKERREKALRDSKAAAAAGRGRRRI